MPDRQVARLESRGEATAGGLTTLFLCGDVMPGRGVDQILPYPGDPELREEYLDDARTYVRLAERANGPIPYPVSFSWPGGTPWRCLAPWHRMCV